MKILILDDGRKGHLNPILSLFDKRPYWKKVIVRIKFKNKLMRGMCFAASLLRLNIKGFLQIALSKISWQQLKLHLNDANAIFSAGSYAASVTYLLSKERGYKSVVFLQSSLARLGVPFGLNIIPYHDKPAYKQNTLKLTFSLNNVDAVRCQTEAEVYRKQKYFEDNNKLTLLIGGNSKHYCYELNWFKKVLADVQKFATPHNWNILCTTSRRTPVDFAEQIPSLIDCEGLVLAHKTEENPILAYFGMSSCILVMEDSFNMISEALASEKKVIVVKVPSIKRQSKFHVTLNHLINNNWIKFWDPLDDNISLNEVVCSDIKYAPVSQDMEEALMCIDTYLNS